jgi:hypothetical protein
VLLKEIGWDAIGSAQRLNKLINMSLVSPAMIAVAFSNIFAPRILRWRYVVFLLTFSDGFQGLKESKSTNHG